MSFNSLGVSKLIVCNECSGRGRLRTPMFHQPSGYGFTRVSTTSDEYIEIICSECEGKGFIYKNELEKIKD